MDKNLHIVLVELALHAFKRIRLLALLFSAMTLVLIFYAAYLRASGARLEVSILALSPILIIGFVLIGIAFVGKKNELGQNAVEIAKLTGMFRRISVMFAFLILLIVCGVILVRLIGAK